MNQKSIPLKVYFGKYFITTCNRECKAIEIGDAKKIREGGYKAVF
jgi:hypothetical protein